MDIDKAGGENTEQKKKNKKKHTSVPNYSLH